MTVKHLQVGAIHLNMNVDEPGPKPSPRGFDPLRLVEVGGSFHATRLPSGMKSGRSAVFLQFDLDDGETLLVECSLALLNSISVAFHARDEVEGKPSSR